MHFGQQSCECRVRNEVRNKMLSIKNQLFWSGEVKWLGSNGFGEFDFTK